MEGCGICFGNQWILKTPCQHILCLECLLKLRKDECPYCRKPLFLSLPIKIRQVLKNSYAKNNTLDINDPDEFPSLG